MIRSHRLAAIAALATVAATPLAAATFVNGIAVANFTDLSGLQGAGQNRLGGFGSDLVYNAASNLWYGITDRGPGGGVLSYTPRLQTFTLDVSRQTGAVANFQLQSTVLFKGPDGRPLDGLNPRQLNGSAATLGNSFDSEGLAILPSGNLLVSDEYGPSIYEFTPAGAYVRAFTTPANLTPREANGAANYVDDRNTIATGRQDNRGFEGLTLSPDGKTAYAILQDPLTDEGRTAANPDGRYSRNVRLVAFDVATGQATSQYIYQLEPVADINDRTATDDFSASNQGRSIGVSAITALGNGKFLVLERDNRGLSTDSTVSTDAGSKRAYLIDLTGATDVSAVSLSGTSTLPAGVVPVTKLQTPTIDILSSLRAAGYVIPEKIEGMSFGPALDDGSRTLMFITDNDFSVTQNGSGTQFDACVGGGTRVEVAIGAGCPTGTDLIPTYIYSYRLAAAEYAALTGASVPEPATWAGMAAGFALLGSALRRRRRTALSLI